MKFAWQILIHTPLWAWALLAFLIWQGIKAMRPRTVTIWRSLVVPAVFIVWGLSRLLSRHDIVWPLAAWLGAAVLLLIIGLLTAGRIELDHTTGEIRRPGSIVPLIRNITVFALQYAVAVIAAVDPHDATAAAIVGRAISGGTTGYFLGRTIACCGSTSGSAGLVLRGDGAFGCAQPFGAPRSHHRRRASSAWPPRSPRAQRSARVDAGRRR